MTYPSPKRLPTEREFTDYVSQSVPVSVSLSVVGD